MRLACGFGDAEIYQTQKQEDLTESSKQGTLSPGPLDAAVPEMLETEPQSSVRTNTPVVKDLELYPRSQQTISTCSGILFIHCEAHSRRLTDMYGKTKKVLNGI